MFSFAPTVCLFLNFQTQDVDQEPHSPPKTESWVLPPVVLQLLHHRPYNVATFHSSRQLYLQISQLRWYLFCQHGVSHVAFTPLCAHCPLLGRNVLRAARVPRPSGPQALSRHVPPVLGHCSPHGHFPGHSPHRPSASPHSV